MELINAYINVSDLFPFSAKQLYIPYIYLINATTCNINELPVIAIGTDFIPLDSIYEDYIPGWIIDEQDTIEMILSEEEAMSTENPVLIITNDFVYQKNQFSTLDRPFTNSTLLNEDDIKGRLNNKRFYISQYQIDFRYEASNHSEYEIKYAISESYGAYYAQSPFRIANVHKSKIGQAQDVWKELFNDRPNLIGQMTPGVFLANKSYSICAVTYEYDFYALKKTVIAPPCSFECKMKFPDEYYQILYGVGLNFSNGSNTEIPSKGFIKIHRND